MRVWRCLQPPQTPKYSENYKLFKVSSKQFKEKSPGQGVVWPYLWPSLEYTPIIMPTLIPTRNKSRGPGWCLDSNTAIIAAAGAIPRSIFLLNVIISDLSAIG